MKLTESQLRKLVKEEIDAMVDEGLMDRMLGRAKGGWAGAKGKVKAAAMGAAGKIAGMADQEAGEKIAAKASDAKQMAQDAAQAAKVNHIVKTWTHELENDLKKLGIPIRRDLLRAINLLKKVAFSTAPTAAVRKEE